MRLLVTNDDGIHAEGLAVLERIARALSDDVWICAPEAEQSGASRSLTLAEPLRVRRLDDRRFAVLGTPTDCVMLAIQYLIKGERPDLVLSGVNRGLNAGEDVTMSGTVAGAIEGMALGVPAIALSQMMGYADEALPAPFETAERFGPGLVDRLVELGWPKDVILNLNFPARPAAAGERGRGDPPGLPRRAHPLCRTAHRPSRPRLLLAGLQGRAVSARPGHRSARRL